jgi:carbohydrate esterase-like sialic acid-specific acetylesterase
LKPTMRVVIGLLALGLVQAWASTAWTDELQRPEKGKKIKVFLLAGQSNMEGRADGAKLTIRDRERLAKVQGRIQLAFNYQPIGALNTVKPSTEIAEIYKRNLIFGPELFFGVALAEAWPEEKILLIKLSAGATSLYGCWNPDWSADKAAAMGEADEAPLYGALTEYVRQILSGYDATEYEIGAMLWVQGETDSANEVAAAAYGNNLRQLVARLRQDLGRATLPFMLFEVGTGKVVEGMRGTANAMENVTLLAQSPDPTSQDFYEKMENGHYNYQGTKKLGHRFAEVFLREYARKGE